ncbi:MAG: bacillithiol biosynthesis cysteine-adding enzyme BshC [Bacteroidota bacterium]
MDWIDFRQLPPSAGGFSELFYDFVYDYDEVKQFFPGNFRDTAAFESVMKAIDAKALDRATLVTVLDEQNKSFGCGEQTFANIALLSKPTTYAVVTGQQVGILGGPMYTVLKTVTAIKLAERLKSKFPHLDFVPVFWIEGEDHDFAEMNNVHLLDGETKPVKIEYLPGGEMPEKNLGAIGEIAFDTSLDATYAAITASLQNTEYTPPLMELLRQSYAVGRTFNTAFASWMNALFSEYGLVFISSNHPSLKKTLSPLFVREINEFPSTSQTVIAQSAELEQNYHAQLKAKSVNLFMFHKGGRYAIEPREHDFSLRGTRHFFGKDELLKIATETPELLSANVVLRPLAQDTLLPTVAYVAGPSEVAYSAQLKPVYEHFGVVQPIVYPRASASFVEERVVRVLEKYQLDLEALFEDGEQVKAKVLEQIEEIKLDKIFGDTTRLVHDALHELRFGVKEVDPTLTSTLDNVQSKFDGNLGVLKEKSLAAQKRRNEAAMRQIDRAIGSLLPNGSLQERELSILYFMNKYGPELPRWLMGEVDITGFKHQILSL